MVISAVDRAFSVSRGLIYKGGQKTRPADRPTDRRSPNHITSLPDPYPPIKLVLTSLNDLALVASTDRPTSTKVYAELRAENPSRR